MQKHVLIPSRVRQVPRQFSWVDQRLVRDRYIARCNPEALALYWFLVTVADARGLSFYADASIERLLSLSPQHLARSLGLYRRTVAKWWAEPRFRPRQPSARASKLDPYKPLIRQWLEAHPYSAQQVLQRLREERFEGGYSIVKDYARVVRPRRAPAFLTLSFAPGECAQIDWGE